MNKKLFLITYITCIFFAIVLITSAVKFTVNFRPLYYFDIDYLNIPQKANVPKEEIIKNYNHLIDYLETSYKGEFTLPTFPISEMGKTHFEDVKDIFIQIDYLMYASLFIIILGSYYLLKNKVYTYIKYTSITLFFLPLILAFLMALNFDAAFTIFHKIFFRNDYWVFDPMLDPIINVLPWQFFMHSAILILLIIIIESILLSILYKYLLKRSVKIVK